MRQRKDKTKNDGKTEERSSKNQTKKKQENLSDRLQKRLEYALSGPNLAKLLERLQRAAIGVVLLMPVLVISIVYRKWGINFFLPTSWMELNMTSAEWKEVLQNRTMVMIGGPHRGGTTILWECLRTHRDITDFGAEHESGLDFSEGVFAQSVYPTFGVGTENERRDKITGIGRYALAEERKVHLKANNPKATVQNQLKVLNRFGYLWDLTNKSILLEKSPVNAVMSSFLQALFNANNDKWIPDPPRFGGGKSFVKFIFISRHPFANAYAQRRMIKNHPEPVDRLILNWIKMHEYLVEDMKSLQYVHFLKFEDFDNDPLRQIKDIWSWLGLAADEEALMKISKLVKTGQNDKYLKLHCKFLSDEGGRKGYQKLVDMYNDRIIALGIGYDLTSPEWECKTQN